MDPLSPDVWLCNIFAYIGVTVVFILVARLSPYEWKQDPVEKKFELDFNVSNTLWFCLAAFMQQGVDIAPRSITAHAIKFCKF